MDHRKALSKNSILPFPSMSVKVEYEIGRGSNAIVYKACYPDASSGLLHSVLLKELFPFHPKAQIYRDEDNSIRCAEQAADIFELHKSSFEYGNKIHLDMLAAFPDQTGGNINTFEHNNTLYTILSYDGGRSLSHELASSEFSIHRLIKIMKGLLRSLKSFHDKQLLHLDIAPDNILIIGSGELERVMLIDYNSVQNLSEIQSRFSIKQGYSSPEVRNGWIDEFDKPSDLYSVAAVFFHCVNGSPLTPFDTTRRTPPDVSDSDMLRNLPETAISMAKQILYRGLQALPEKRYTDAKQMLAAFDELQDRVDGIGITHWALWEAGQKTIAKLLRDNSALNYLKDASSIFPTRICDSSNEVFSADQCIADMMDGGKNLFVTAPGGMGKTTSMLYTLKKHSERYSPSEPAIIYIPLNSRIPNKSNYIMNRILEHLHFKSDISGYEEARHELLRLMLTPLTAKSQKKRPVAVLFIDGLNEAEGNLDELMNELCSLSKLDGVRLYITSRTKQQLPNFAYYELVHLLHMDVTEILSKHHLLMPESENMQILLRTPIMLSMFLQSAQNDQKQVSAETAEELMQAYLSSLINKKLSALDEDSDSRFKIQVATDLILPRLAGKIQRKRRSLTDAELLSEVQACYKIIKSPFFSKVFPQWIGRKSAILSGTDCAEDWYAIIVRDILWRQLGLLIRTEVGEYQNLHQIIGGYLSKLNRTNQSRVIKYQSVKYGSVAVACALAVCAGYVAYLNMIAPLLQVPPDIETQTPEMLQPHDEAYAQAVLTVGIQAYNRSGSLCGYLNDLLNTAANDPSLYDLFLEQYRKGILNVSAEEQNTFYDLWLGNMLESGQVMPWSEQVFRTQEYSELMGFCTARTADYEPFVSALSFAMKNPDTMQAYGSEYVELFGSLADKDAEIAAALYAISCRTHVNYMLEQYNLSDDVEHQSTSKNITAALKDLNPNCGDTPDTRDDILLADALNRLKNERNTILDQMRMNGVYGSYTLNQGENQ